MDMKERDKYRAVLRKAAPDLRKYLAIDDGLLVEFAAVDVITLEEKEIIQNPQLIYHQKVDKLLEFIRVKIHIAFFPFMELLKEKDEELHKHVSKFISEGASTTPPASQPQEVQQANTARRKAPPRPPPPQPRATPKQGASTMPPHAPVSQPQKVQQANTARKSASPAPQPCTTPSQGAVQQPPQGASTMPADAPASQPQQVQQTNTARKSAPSQPQPCTTSSQGKVQQPPQDDPPPLVDESASTQQQIVSIKAGLDHAAGNVDDNSGNSLPELVDQLDIKTEVNKPSPDSSCEKKAIIKKDAAPRWKLSGLLNTGTFNGIIGIAINQDGDIVLTSYNNGVNVYSRSSTVKCTLYTSPGAQDVAVTHDNKYVTPPMGQTHIAFHDRLGKRLHTVPIYDVNYKPSYVNTLAVDSNGKIIVGQTDNTISIYHQNVYTGGYSIISKFASQLKPYRLAITSNDEIVSSIYDPALNGGASVHLMNYSGKNIRVIQPPPDVKVWVPSYVCCREGEIFVVNGGGGNPRGVYRYASLGEYLGCVTTDVSEPTGIALSEDGNELFVAEYHDKVVKIFQRQ